MQNFEFVIPVVVGTAAFYLGKKVAIATLLLPWHSSSIVTDITCMILPLKSKTLCRLLNTTHTSGPCI